MICEICKREFSTCQSLGIHTCKIHKVSTKAYYDRYLKKDGESKCKICGKETYYKGMVLGYQIHCSLKCSNNDPDMQTKQRESFFKNDLKKIDEKRRKTNLEKYGVVFTNQHNLYPEESKRKLLEKKINYLNQRAKDSDLTLLDYSNYSGFESSIKLKCNVCNFEFEDITYRIFMRTYKCPECMKKNIKRSVGEKEVATFITEELKEELILNKRIENREVDILIQSKNVAIDYNGLYCHSEEVLSDPKHYHVDKLNIVNRNGIKFIQIFEDEWIEKKEICKDRIRSILGKESLKIYARRCDIKPISKKVKDEFLNSYHMMGTDISKVMLGAFYNNELVSVMTFSHGKISKGRKKEEGVWELNRFCNKIDTDVVGIAGKFLEYFKSNYSWKEIFSYADRRWSDGRLYFKIGFRFNGYTKPNFWFSKDGYTRYHRFLFRTSKNSSDPKEIPEQIIRRSQDYYRIWDCGSIRFQMLNTNFS